MLLKKGANKNPKTLGHLFKRFKRYRGKGREKTKQTVY